MARSRRSDRSNETNQPDEYEPDPERLVECAYWRCIELFEQRAATHRFCRKACRSRHGKWTRAQERKQRRTS